MNKTILDGILRACQLETVNCERVGGGDINECYRVETRTDTYFLKVNEAAAYPGMFEKEAGGLRHLKTCSSLEVPAPLIHGKYHNFQYLLLEWLEKSSPGNQRWQQLGTGVAALHKNSNSRFGYPTDNFIGSLVQLNHQHSSWSEFYAECRILPLVRTLVDKQIFTKAEIKRAAAFCLTVGSEFPVEPPSLLHGDLWSGNCMFTLNGNPAIFDPAVYYGHREMDLGLSLLFGGFTPAFYQSYNEAYPLEVGWKSRIPATQLYPLLVHAVLFGGHYINQVKGILQDY